MPARTFSLTALFTLTTVCAIVAFAYPNFSATNDTWSSGLRNYEIHSAKVENIFDDSDNENIRQLSKRDSIRFVRLAEKCPLREFEECPGISLPNPDAAFLSVDLKLSNNRNLGIALIDDCLRTPDCLIDITSRRDEILKILRHGD